MHRVYSSKMFVLPDAHTMSNEQSLDESVFHSFTFSLVFSFSRVPYTAANPSCFLSRLCAHHMEFWHFENLKCCVIELVSFYLCLFFAFNCLFELAAARKWEAHTLTEKNDQRKGKKTENMTRG